MMCVQVDVGQLAPTSVTEYAWRVKFAMKPPKEAVKYSENATVNSEVEVRPQGEGEGVTDCVAHPVPACFQLQWCWVFAAALGVSKSCRPLTMTLSKSSSTAP
jgi:hypothetical protein